RHQSDDHAVSRNPRCSHAVRHRDRPCWSHCLCGTDCSALAASYLRHGSSVVVATDRIGGRGFARRCRYHRSRCCSPFATCRWYFGSAHWRSTVYLDCPQYQGSGACLMSTPNISLPSTVSSTSRNSEDSGNSTATPRLVHALSAARYKRRRQYFALLIILT